jgi:23S rRNA-/tRNA-specific pseudouridylate synthase
VPNGRWATALDFLSERLPRVSRDEWHRRLLAREVFDGAGQTVAPDARLRAGQHLHYYRDLPDEAPIPFEEHIVFQDEWLVVADKPHFLPVTPTGPYVQQSLLVRLRRRLGLDTLQPIHRIDRETAGLTVFAVQPATRDAYHGLFRERAVTKTYEAIAPAPGTLAFPRVHRNRIEEDAGAFFRMVETPGEANSETRIEVLEVRGTHARYGLATADRAPPPVARQHGCAGAADHRRPVLPYRAARPARARRLQPTLAVAGTHHRLHRSGHRPGARLRKPAFAAVARARRLNAGPVIHSPIGRTRRQAA